MSGVADFELALTNSPVSLSLKVTWKLVYVNKRYNLARYL